MIFIGICVLLVVAVSLVLNVFFFHARQKSKNREKTVEDLRREAFGLLKELRACPEKPGMCFSKFKGIVSRAGQEPEEFIGCTWEDIYYWLGLAYEHKAEIALSNLRKGEGRPEYQARDLFDFILNAQLLFIGLEYDEEDEALMDKVLTSTLAEIGTSREEVYGLVKAGCQRTLEPWKRYKDKKMVERLFMEELTRCNIGPGSKYTR